MGWSQCGKNASNEDFKNPRVKADYRSNPGISGRPRGQHTQRSTIVSTDRIAAKARSASIVKWFSDLKPIATRTRSSRCSAMRRRLIHCDGEPPFLGAPVRPSLRSDCRSRPNLVFSRYCLTNFVVIQERGGREEGGLHAPDAGMAAGAPRKVGVIAGRI